MIYIRDDIVIFMITCKITLPDDVRQIEITDSVFKPPLDSSSNTFSTAEIAEWKFLISALDKASFSKPEVFEGSSLLIAKIRSDDVFESNTVTESWLPFKSNFRTRQSRSSIFSMTWEAYVFSIRISGCRNMRLMRDFSNFLSTFPEVFARHSNTHSMT